MAGRYPLAVFVKVVQYSAYLCRFKLLKDGQMFETRLFGEI